MGRMLGVQRLVWAVTKLGATLRVEVMLQAIGRFVGVVCFRVRVVLEWGVWMCLEGVEWCVCGCACAMGEWA